jgi:hypothetical protein
MSERKVVINLAVIAPELTAGTMVNAARDSTHSGLRYRSALSRAAHPWRVPELPRAYAE